MISCSGTGKTNTPEHFEQMQMSLISLRIVSLGSSPGLSVAMKESGVAWAKQEDGFVKAGCADLPVIRLQIKQCQSRNA